MRLNDADGQPRLTRATRLLGATDAGVSRQFTPEVYGVGDGLEPVRLDRLRADGRRSDLGRRVAAVRERYRASRWRESSSCLTAAIRGAVGSGWRLRGPPVFAVGRLAGTDLAIAK